jgi:hypothetical protein
VPSNTYSEYRHKRPELRGIPSGGDLKMSRLHLTPDQIDALDMETLEDIRAALNDELCVLAEVERSVYKRRRQLEIEADPSLLEDDFDYTPKPMKVKKKLTAEELISLIKSSGIDPNLLKQFT